ncbi:MAG: hypothetical protein KF788_08760 [Piscinibacter sp.]|nr:hypothetical protein [Piscinibacter sp.]
MDKRVEGEATKQPRPWGWVPAAMPGVARLMADRRREYGDAHVNLCWQRGVVERRPGWFFALEGAIALGTPDDDQRLAWFAALGPRWIGGKGSTRAEAFTPGQALLDMRRPEPSHGTQ